MGLGMLLTEKRLALKRLSERREGARLVITDVRFASESGHVQRRNRCLLCAKSGHPFDRNPAIRRGRGPIRDNK